MKKLLFLFIFSLYITNLNSINIDKVLSYIGFAATGLMAYGLFEGYNNYQIKYKNVKSSDQKRVELKRKIKTQLIIQTLFTPIIGLISYKLFANAKS
jgi:hypothetical protein